MHYIARVQVEKCINDIGAHSRRRSFVEFHRLRDGIEEIAALENGNEMFELSVSGLLNNCGSFL